MQVMKLNKHFKNLEWCLGASELINNFEEATVIADFEGFITKI